jgi:hypothetical protein
MENLKKKKKKKKTVHSVLQEKWDVEKFAVETYGFG